VGISSSADLDAAFDEVSRQHPDALIVLTTTAYWDFSNMIVHAGDDATVPVFANQSFVFSQAGTLVNYSRI